MIPESLKGYQPFENWLSDVTANGHELRSVQVNWEMKVGKHKDILLFAVVHVSVYIPEENREKSNEHIFLRPDISCVVAYLPNSNYLKTEILLVKEFRSNTRNKSTFELPGGSSLSKDKAKTVALHELVEETGLTISSDRLNFFQSRQMVSTLATYKANAFAVELTPSEMETLRKDTNTYGISADSEQTYVTVKSLENILSDTKEDWSTIGIILSALQNTQH